MDSVRAQNKILCRVMDLPTLIWASLFAPLMFAGLPNHSTLLTMLKVVTIFLVNIILYSFFCNEAETMCFFPRSRFYLDIKKGQEVDRICGSRTGFSVLSDSSSLFLRYHADRYTRRASGFQAQYYMLNGSLTKGQSSKFMITYLKIAHLKKILQQQPKTQFRSYSQVR